MPATNSAKTKAKTVVPSAKPARFRKPFRTNTHCTSCKRELRPREGAICDECRMTTLGWKKV